MYKIGQIISREEVELYIKSLADIDEDMFEIYTRIFSEYICDIVELSVLDYSRINREEESEIINQYECNVENMPPIVVSPSFNGKRIVYDGCHRCIALENLGIKYSTADNVECDEGKCCFCCEKANHCGGICNYCHDMGKLCNIISKNVYLFCNGVW